MEAIGFLELMGANQIEDINLFCMISISEDHPVLYHLDITYQI